MNRKQAVLLMLMVAAIILIVIFTPRYKILWLDSNNFIKTEQRSSLYKRSKGTETLYVDKIIIYSGLVVVGGGILMFALRDRRP